MFQLFVIYSGPRLLVCVWFKKQQLATDIETPAHTRRTHTRAHALTHSLTRITGIIGKRKKEEEKKQRLAAEAVITITVSVLKKNQPLHDPMRSESHSKTKYLA